LLKQEEGNKERNKNQENKGGYKKSEKIRFVLSCIQKTVYVWFKDHVHKSLGFHSGGTSNST